MDMLFTVFTSIFENGYDFYRRYFGAIGAAVCVILTFCSVIALAMILIVMNAK
jgi:hypothetical protein